MLAIDSSPQPRRQSGGSATLGGARPGRYDKFAWTTCAFMTLFHVCAVWALFQFTWSGLAVFLVTYYVSLAWGIGMGYHRLLTHRSFKAKRRYLVPSQSPSGGPPCSSSPTTSLAPSSATSLTSPPAS
jgi:hypothetical protein